MLVDKEVLTPKYVSFMLTNRFFTHKVDFFPEKVDHDLDLVKIQIELIRTGNHKQVRSYFREIRGLINRIYILKIQDDIKEDLKDLVMTETVYAKFYKAWMDATIAGLVLE